MFPPLRLKSAMTLGGLSAREVVLRTWKGINDHEIMTRAAAVSFYAMLAMVPFLALTLTVAVQQLPDITGSFGGKVRGIGNMTVEQLEVTVKTLFPAEVQRMVLDQIARIQKQPPVGLLSIGVIVSLWLASSLFLAIMDAMNRVYGVVETRSIVKLRLTAAVMTIIQAITLLGSLLLIVAWPQILEWMGLDPKGTAALLVTIVKLVVIYLMVLISFALTFYVAPDAQQRWEWISPGSLLGAVLFLAFSFLFRVYVQNFANYDKTYGSLGGVMVILFWFWVVSLLLLAAGEMNKVIEAASPLGKVEGQKVDATLAPDFKAMPAEPKPKLD